MTAARLRMVNGETRYSKVSRFVEEIPAELIQAERLYERAGRQRNNETGADGLPWAKSRQQKGVSMFGMKSNSYDSPTPDFSGTPACGAGIFDAAGAGGRASKNPAPAFGKQFTVQRQTALDYGVGDRIRHIKFGEGTVQAIEDGARDYEVSVNFDGAGTKKMFASFAKLKKI